MKKKLKQELTALAAWHTEQGQIARANAARLIWPGSIAAHTERAVFHENAADAIMKGLK